MGTGERKESKLTMMNPNENEAVDWWQTECEKAVRVFSNLLHLAGRRQAGSAILELLRTAPGAPEEADAISTDSLFGRTAKEACDRAQPCDHAMLTEFCDYIDHLVAMPASLRSMLEASVAGVILGWGMGAF
jgi:hypothetical protein